MAKYSKFDPNNKKRSRDKRAKQGQDKKIHFVDSKSRLSSNELTRLHASN